MKKSRKKSVKLNFIGTVVFVFIMIVSVLGPFLIAFSPTFLMSFYGNMWFSLLFFISVPIGVTLIVKVFNGWLEKILIFMLSKQIFHVGRKKKTRN